jgi:hypothetical protein
MTLPVKNKGGRPTKAEQLAKGITESELKTALRFLKRVHGDMIQSLILDLEDTQLSLKDRIKLKFDLIKLYESLLKTDKTLKSSLELPEPADEGEAPTKVVFRLA